jgi:penicillin-binding protein 1A
MLWLLYGVPIETPPLQVHTPASHVVAKDAAALRPIRPLRTGQASPQDFGRQAAAQDRLGAADAGQQRASTTPIEAAAGADQNPPVQTAPQDRPAAGQQEISGALMGSRPGMQCNLDLCAGMYRSFRAADCTYQPYDGGPRRICER